MIYLHMSIALECDADWTICTHGCCWATKTFRCCIGRKRSAFISDFDLWRPAPYIMSASERFAQGMLHLGARLSGPPADE